MSHAYLSFSDSTYYSGFLVVGTSSSPGSSNFGNGLADKSVKNVEIPSTFGEKTVAELGYCSFGRTNIESVFIPKTIKMLGNAAFYGCNYLKEVRFEKGIELEKIDYNAFIECYALTKIDIPPTLKTVVSNSNSRIFKDDSSLECFSYLGSSDFTSSYFFNTDKVVVHVSKNYPYSTLGQKSVTKDDKTCGVSDQPFSKSKKKICSIFIRCRCSQNYIKYMIFIVLS